ncbi:MAG: hypothetical protein QGI34_18135, partial [Candidatus Latescibacteria bacterium]|nr:hypothetical protein [Candidatus Latescibacterota bacterium]
MKQHHWTTALIILGVMTVWADRSNAQKVTGVEKKSLTNHKHGISSIDFTSNSNLMASGSWDKTVILWSMPACKPKRTLSGHEKAVWDLSFSPDDKIIATASSDNTAKLWRVKDGELLYTLKG